MSRAWQPGERVAQEFAGVLADQHRRLGGDPAHGGVLARWAAQAWRAAAAGNACVDLDAASCEALRSSPVVGPGAGLRALVIDRGALYLYRLWQAERVVADAVRALDAVAPLADAAAREAALSRLFAGRDPGDEQQRAVACALERRLTVLSGGPGTGKTTTLARLLLAYASLVPQARVALAAPTGKAAARLAQALMQQLAQFDANGELRSRLPEQGQTVHRLLGARSDLGTVTDHDLVIVDEASMLDVELAARLLSAIGPQARLVLAGDRDQLASVEAGAVFADLCAAPLAGVITLRHNYRQQDAPDIAALATAIRDAAQGAAIEWPASVRRALPQPAAIVDEALLAWREAFAQLRAGAPPERVLACWDRHRVLGALREGPLGVEALNRAIAAQVRRQAADGSRATWYPGRLVMVSRNEPGLGLFNGDVGVCVEQAGGPASLVVAFTGSGPLRRFPVLQMPACEDAWAMTVHKAQGSEFESVALVLPPPGHALNTRELAYTGVTRARARLSVWATPGAIEDAAQRFTHRHGRLSSRLAVTIAPQGKA